MLYRPSGCVVGRLGTIGTIGVMRENQTADPSAAEGRLVMTKNEGHYRGAAEAAP